MRSVLGDEALGDVFPEGVVFHLELMDKQQ